MKKSYQLVLEDLKSQEKKIMDKMGNVPTYEREYLDLKRQQEILQGVYLILLQKREEIALASGHGRDKGLILEIYTNRASQIICGDIYGCIYNSYTCRIFVWERTNMFVDHRI